MMIKEGIKQFSIIFFAIFLIVLLLPITFAADAGVTPDSPLYIADKAVDNALISMKYGEKKAQTALDVNKERVAEAGEMVKKGNREGALKALEQADKAVQIAKSEAGPNIEEDVAKSTEEITEMLYQMKEEMKDEPETWKDVEELVSRQLSEQERVKIASELAKKIAQYCDGLAKQSFETMMEDQTCGREDVPEWLEEYIDEEIMAREEEAKDMMIEMLTTCMMDPRQCDCSRIPVADERQDCETGSALAVRCEYENDKASCEELEKKGMPSAPENMPDFLKPIFESTIKELLEKKSQQMFDKLAPQECKDAGAKTREECESIMMQKYGAPPEECMRDGEFIGEDECKQIMIDKYMPQECKDASAYTQEECEKLMIEKYTPEECKAVGAYTQEACEAIMQQKAQEVQEQFENIYAPEENVMVCNQETGQCETIPREEIERIISETPSEGAGLPGEIGDLQQEIDDLQEQLAQPSLPSGEEPGGYLSSPSEGETGIPSEGGYAGGAGSGGETAGTGGDGGFAGGESSGSSDSGGSYGGGDSRGGSSGGDSGGGSSGGDSGGGSSGGGDSGGGGSESAPTGGFWMIDFIIGR
ncbi:hypothetical protein HZB88_03435 [archaeon]|nr:hypothetical protein [archaeon]